MAKALVGRTHVPVEQQEQHFLLSCARPDCSAGMVAPCKYSMPLNGFNGAEGGVLFHRQQ